MKSNLLQIISNYLLSKEAKDELAQFNDWEKDSSENLKVLQELDEVWVASEDLGSYQEFDTKAGWEAFSKKAQTTDWTEMQTKRRKWPMLAAACIALLAAVTFWNTGTPIVETPIPQLAKYAAIDKVEAHSLSDNSEIWLNRNSTIQVTSDFTEIRSLSLVGQAYFAIERDESRPFVIETPHESIRVLGTAFDLEATDKKFELYVTEGKVEVSTSKRRIQVRKNQKLSKVNGDYVLYETYNPNAHSWRTNLLVFENTSLSKVLQTLEEHYAVKILNTANVNLDNCTITSTFENENLEDILAELIIIAKLEVVNKSADTYEITSLSCE